MSLKTRLQKLENQRPNVEPIDWDFRGAAEEWGAPQDEGLDPIELEMRRLLETSPSTREKNDA